MKQQEEKEGRTVAVSSFLALVASAYHLLLQPLEATVPLLDSSPGGLEGSRSERWLVDQEGLKNLAEKSKE